MKKKFNVYEPYATIADWFDATRSPDLFEKPYLDFADKGYQLTGIDGSQKMIDLARTHVPNATFLVEDMRHIALPETFDALIAWHSFFHLMPNEQRTMFTIFQHHCNPGGILIFTTEPDAGEIWSENNHENLYHASLSPLEYKALLNQHGFEIIKHIQEDKECGDATIWIARYKNPLLRCQIDYYIH